eukprot:m.32797 g.32797  ORF g.32797 m.32797 type:complete len:504 (-) comp8451_c0_seq2:1209-2720(-)
MSAGRESFAPSSELLHSLQENGAEDTVMLLKQASRSLDGQVEGVLLVCERARESTFPYLQPKDDSTPVHSCFNDAYALASIQYAKALLLTLEQNPLAKNEGNKESEDEDSDDESDASSITCKHMTDLETAAATLRAVDLAILRGGAKWIKCARSVILEASRLQQKAKLSDRVSHNDTSSDCRGSKSTDDQRKRRRLSNSQPNTPASREAAASKCQHWKDGESATFIEKIERRDASTLEATEFRTNYLAKKQPVIIENAASNWKAMGADDSPGWQNMNYLKDIAGDRQVLVEVCDEADVTQTYLTDSWEQRVMSIGEFIDDYLLKQQGLENKRAYLAQYSLFEQIPTLQDDFYVPKYCKELLPEDDNHSENVPGQGDDHLCINKDGVRVSAWLGPEGTVTPLHYDPYHNILVQVAGYKYIRLYSSEQSHRLYPRDPPLINNSHINLDKETMENTPLFHGTPGWHGVIGPGDALHIPRHCWHYVRSLSLSFSVSFFWGASLAKEH